MSPALQNKLKLWLGILFAVLSAIAGTRQVGDGVNWSTDLMPLVGEGGALVASLWAVLSGSGGLLKTPPPVPASAGSESLAAKLAICTHAMVLAVGDGNKLARDAAMDLIDAFSKGKDASPRSPGDVQ
jgi:hypothetical protein